MPKHCANAFAKPPTAPFRATETASEDPFLNGVFAREITRGLQEGEDSRFLLVAACLKHFAVYSLEDYYTPNGTHVTRENVNNVVSQFEAHDSYYPHFRAAVLPVAQGGGGAAGIMMAMNSVNGVPALASLELINTLKSWSGANNAYITVRLRPPSSFFSAKIKPPSPSHSFTITLRRLMVAT